VYEGKERAYKTEQEYKDSIRAIKPVVYAFGEKVEQVVDHPTFTPTLNSIALTSKMARNIPASGYSRM